MLTLAAAKSWAAVQRNVHLYIALPMHSLKLCTVGRWVRVDSRATEAWQARVIPFHSFWVFEAASKPRPYRGSVQYHAPRLVTLSSAAPSNSPHSGVAALTVAQMSRNYVEVWFQHFPQQANENAVLANRTKPLCALFQTVHRQRNRSVTASQEFLSGSPERSFPMLIQFGSFSVPDTRKLSLTRGRRFS